jgi:diacylglycerol kinase family enzyme
VRALLIVNPHASSTTASRRDVIARALASSVDLDVVHTRYRGHAAQLAREAAADGQDVLFILGGDGTINEAVNGLLRACGRAVADSTGPTAEAAGSGAAAAAGPAADATGTRDDRPAAGDLPALAPIPGGSANVFVRALGIPADPVDATSAILASISTGRERRIGLGMAGDRYFTCSGGMGLDAEVIRAVECHRAEGRPASAALYVLVAVQHFYGVTDRRQPALTLERPGMPPIGPLFIGIVSNTSPWTYLGNHRVNPNPCAGFGTGLDLFALRRLRTPGTLNTLRQMLTGGDRPLRGRHIVSLHDEAQMTLRSGRPIACQVDGEYVGESECITFRSVPEALRVVT